MAFIEKANKIYNNKYDYSKFIYKGCSEKGIIICPIHGEFLQSSNAHLDHSCNKCAIKFRAKEISYTFDEFIDKANKVHKNKYDYSKFIYINSGVKGIIICKKHGDFLKTPGTHINSKQGCPMCGKERCDLSAIKRRKTQEQFIKEASLFHNNKYDYSRVVYIGNFQKIEIGCSIHGWFLQMPHYHLKSGCFNCGQEISRQKRLGTKEEFVEKANMLYHNKYDYSQSNYINLQTKTEIICPIHGLFIKRPDAHLNGQGCQRCAKGKEGVCEKTTRYFFEQFFGQKFEKIRPYWLMGNKKFPLELDGYCENLNIAFEYQGEQHYMQIPNFSDFEYRKTCDELKRIRCKERGVFLIEIPYFRKKFSKHDLKAFVINYLIQNNLELPENYNNIIIDFSKI